MAELAQSRPATDLEIATANGNQLFGAKILQGSIDVDPA